MAYDVNTVLKASSAETSSTDGSGIEINGTPLRGVDVRMVISEVDGTTPTMTVAIQHSDSLSSGYSTVASFDQVTGAGTHFLKVHTNKKYIRYASTIGGSNPSFTYSLDVGLSQP